MTKENEEGFKRTAEAVEGAGACLIAQLWHPGRQQLWSPVWSPKGISDQPDAYSWTVPHVMTTDELRQVVLTNMSPSRSGSSAAASAARSCTARTAI